MKKHSLGLSLIELMVALSISLVLMLGATTIYNRSRATHDQNEGIARLQETARYAMSIVEPDVRSADYWGLREGGWTIEGRAGPADPVSPIANGAPANVCGVNYAVNLDAPLWGDNDSYRLSSPGNAGSATACLTLPRDATVPGVTWTSAPVMTADTLTVRRASVCNPDPNNDGNPADSTCPVDQAGRLQVCSKRNSGDLHGDGLSGCPAWPAGQLGNVVVDTYYVDRNSEEAAGLPSLRRKTLTSAGGVIQFEDREIIAGVEDMQVQFGIQPGFALNPAASTAQAASYVNPGDPALAGAQIVAVRLWLMVRADTPEAGFIDSRVYEYGNRRAANGVTGDLNVAGAAGLAFQPSIASDTSFLTGPRRFRRLLVSRTIQVRNAMGT